MHNLFVYGTLKQGHSNHRFLRDSNFLGAAATQTKYTMVHLGGFPGVTQKKTSVIHGELYEIDDDTLRNVDRLEGHPSFYKRKTIKIDHENVTEAFTYILPNEEYKNYKVIESGVWE